jgi:hypothetical protein
MNEDPNEADVPAYVTEGVDTKDLAPKELSFPQPSRRKYPVNLSAELSNLCFVRIYPRMLGSCKAASFWLSKIATRAKSSFIYKARDVVQGFLDPLKQRAVHNSPSLKQDMFQLDWAFASICGFEVWNLDISQACQNFRCCVSARLSYCTGCGSRLGHLEHEAML